MIAGPKVRHGCVFYDAKHDKIFCIGTPDGILVTFEQNHMSYLIGTHCGLDEFIKKILEPEHVIYLGKL